MHYDLFPCPSFPPSVPQKTPNLMKSNYVQIQLPSNSWISLEDTGSHVNWRLASLCIYDSKSEVNVPHWQAALQLIHSPVLHRAAIPFSSPFKPLIYLGLHHVRFVDPLAFHFTKKIEAILGPCPSLLTTSLPRGCLCSLILFLPVLVDEWSALQRKKSIPFHLSGFLPKLPLKDFVLMISSFL